MSHNSMIRNSKRILHGTRTLVSCNHGNLDTVCRRGDAACDRRFLSSHHESAERQLFPSTSFYRITPDTVCEVLSHDVKAASLTKALYIDCLPPSLSVKEASTEFHKTWKKAFLESFFFTPEHRHMSNRRNRKSNALIMESLYSNLLKLLFSKVDVGRISVDRDPYFQYPFYRSLPERPNPDALLIEGVLKYNILSDTPAAPLFSSEDCLQTRDFPLQWDDIISPLLGYEEISLPDNITPGLSAASLHRHPYSRVILDIGGGAEWSDTSRARGIYFLFARLASEAIRDGYRMGDILDRPRVGAYISGSGYSFHTVFYQLNTLDLVGEDGIKNLAWGSSVDNTTTNLLPMKKVEPENLLGPAVLEQVIDLIKTALLYDLPRSKNDDGACFD